MACSRTRRRAGRGSACAVFTARVEDRAHPPGPGRARTRDRRTQLTRNTRAFMSNTVQFKTSLGEFTVELEPKDAPISVENFLKYVDDGFFDGTIFHRIVPGFVIQGGGL